jgi:N,N'-diacetyllegionaminate synthase
MNNVSPRIIAEIGNSHEGSLGIALSMISMAADAGADIVKFQFHISEYESTLDEPFRDQTFIQDLSRKQYWERVSFSKDEWVKIFKHCEKNNIEFLCTPFSLEAAQILFENGLIKRWKIGSGDALNFQLLDFVFRTELEVLVSTGLINSSELKNLVDFISNNYNFKNLVLMHCVSEYPTNLVHSSISLIDEYRKMFSVRVGHSDHSGNISTLLYALTHEIDYIEMHLTPHKLFFGPDTKASITPEELEQVVKFKNDLEIMKASNFSRDQLYELSLKNAKIFRKSLYWNQDLPSGSKINAAHVAVKKPLAEIDAFRISEVIGRITNISVQRDKPINLSDLS